MGFQLVLKSVTLNDLERRNSPNSIDWYADYVIVVEDRPIRISSSSYILAKTDPRSSRMVSTTAELLVLIVFKLKLFLQVTATLRCIFHV